jgi:hypothetical protein
MAAVSIARRLPAISDGDALPPSDLRPVSESAGLIFASRRLRAQTPSTAARLWVDPCPCDRRSPPHEGCGGGILSLAGVQALNDLWEAPALQPGAMEQ